MNNKIALVNAYYGKFPAYFQNWLECARHNDEIDFFVITDISMTDYDIPANVKILEWSFDELKKRFQDIFPFKICLDTPYKLCDYKPAYGKLLEGYISKYDWWGYIDFDIIFGRITKYLAGYLDNKYIRIGRNGHFSIFRNTEDMRMIFLKTFPAKEVYKPQEVYRHRHTFAWDEIGGGRFRFGTTHGMETSGLKIADLSNHIADIHITKKDFSSNRNDEEFVNEIFKWHDGILEELHTDGEKIVTEELMYVHFQKRKLDVKTINRENYYIIPNEILESYQLDIETKHISSEAENQEWWLNQRKKILRSRIKTGALYWAVKDTMILKLLK